MRQEKSRFFFMKFFQTLLKDKLCQENLHVDGSRCAKKVWNIKSSETVMVWLQPS